MAAIVGNGEREGNIAYGVTDLGLSAYDLGRHVLSPDSWCLFRYIRTDYMRPYKGMKANAMGFEIYTDFQTGKQLYQETGK